MAVSEETSLGRQLTLDGVLSGWCVKKQLKVFQREDVDLIKKHGLRVLLASSPGTGKSAIAATAVLETGRWSLPCLVVCPASVTLNWVKEMKMWAEHLRCHVINDMATRIPPGFDVYITSWALIDPRLGDFLRIKFNSFIIDEAHYGKNEKSFRSRALYQLTRDTGERHKGIQLLTGTPIINKTEEMDVLHSLFDKTPLRIRRILEDVAPEVPPKKRSYVYIRLRERDQVEYDKAVDDFEHWLRRKKEKLLGEGMAEDVVERSIAAEAFTKFGYLRRLLGEAKVPAASDWIARAVRVGEPVVVFLEHQHTLEQLSEMLHKQRIRHLVIEGSTPPKKRQAYVDAFQKNIYPVIICTDAGAEGITLTAARHLLIVERALTSAKEEQKEERVHRISQKHKTTIWFLHASGTLDDRLDVIIRNKRRIIREAIGAASVGENEISSVENLIKGWDNFVTQTHKTTDLGQGKELPPLPRPGSTYAILFGSKRWSKKNAERWATMHGYLPRQCVPAGSKMRLTVHPIEVFQPHAFKSFRVCADIQVVTGKRLSAANEALVRRTLNHRRLKDPPVVHRAS